MSGVVPSGDVNGQPTNRTKAGADTSEGRLPPKAVKLLLGHEGEVSDKHHFISGLNSHACARYLCLSGIPKSRGYLHLGKIKIARSKACAI